MRNYLLLVAASLLAAACSSPRYTYQFDHYNSGKKETPAMRMAAEVQPASPLALDQNLLVASTEAAPILLAATTPTVSADAQARQAASNLSKKYNAMSKAEKKQFRQEVKSQVKAYAKATRAGNKAAADEAVQAMDHDLKLAIIFGAVGLTLTLFGGVSEAFWVLGVISVVIGVVFLIKWLVRQ